MPITYPLDPSGVSPANLVEGEIHSVSEAKFRDYNFIVPNFAPFFVDNFQMVFTYGGETRILQEDVDYSFALSYVTGTRTYGKAMYGAITVHNLNVNGLLQLRYQTLGGDQVADRLQILTTLADKAYNPRTTIWDIITNVPNALPPTPHYQDYDTFYGQEQVVQALNEIRDAILTNSSLTADEIRSFLENINSINVSSFMLRTGGVMTGPLILSRDPVERNEAVTKDYLDQNTASVAQLSQVLSEYPTLEEVQTLLGNKVNRYGDTMTGHLTLNATPTDDLHAANKNYVDSAVGLRDVELSGLSSQVAAIASDYVKKSDVEQMIHEVLLRIGFVS